MSSKSFLETVKARRTIYALKKESTISDAKIQEIIKEAVLHVPSSFNSQSTRVVLLVKEEHDKLWEIAKETLKAIVPAEQYPATEQRLNGFKAGYGTVLFFESTAVVSGMQEKFALYADKFPLWATQSDAMTQFVIWAALEAEGLGANLQHYNPLIDQKVADTWGIDKDWVLNAQLVFGTPAGAAGEKTFIPVEERFKSFGV
ncbi:Nitroreductase-like protein [Cadophora sp. MPI-SDFR-AT-0126]|nr:Nitroreductase-like protein [Leotiomycetes sp. MPI-SDFR-AT-0126]